MTTADPLPLSFAKVGLEKRVVVLMSATSCRASAPTPSNDMAQRRSRALVEPACVSRSTARSAAGSAQPLLQVAVTCVTELVNCGLAGLRVAAVSESAGLRSSTAKVSVAPEARVALFTTAMPLSVAAVGRSIAALFSVVPAQDHEADGVAPLAPQPPQ